MSLKSVELMSPHKEGSSISLPGTLEIEAAAAALDSRAGVAAAGRLHTSRIVALAASLRLGILWLVVTHFPHDWLFGRGIELGLVADNLQAGRGFSSPYGGSTGPTALLAPGYPAVIAVAAIGVVTLMAEFVLPRLTKFFKQFGVQRPPLTARILIQISDFFKNQWYVVPALAVLFVTVLVVTKQTERGRSA